MASHYPIVMNRQEVTKLSLRIQCFDLFRFLFKILRVLCVHTFVFIFVLFPV